MFAKALRQSNPCSWMVRLMTARIVPKIREIDDVVRPRSISQSLKDAASAELYVSMGRPMPALFSRKL